MAAAENQGPAAGGPRGAAEAEADGMMGLTDLPGELLELILCCDVLGAADIGRVSCTCRRLREACQPRGKVWRERFRLRWARPGTARSAGEGGLRWLDAAWRGRARAARGRGGALSAQAGPRPEGVRLAAGTVGPGGPGCSWGGGSVPPPSHPILDCLLFPAPRGAC